MSEKEKIIAELCKKEDDPEYHHAIKIAHQTIENMQVRLNQKEEMLKKYQDLLAKAREVFMSCINFFSICKVFVLTGSGKRTFFVSEENTVTCFVSFFFCRNFMYNLSTSLNNRFA